MPDWLVQIVSTPWQVAVLSGIAGLLVGAWLTILMIRIRTGKRTRETTEKLLMALERALRDEPREAFEVLRREAEQPDAPPALYFALAAALRRLDMTERSAQLHRGLLARHRLSKAERIRAQLGLAVDYLQLGRASMAEEILRELPRSVRRHPNLLQVRQKTALEAEDWKEALESTALMVRRGRQEKAEIADVYAKMGHHALEKEDVKQAIKSFRRALRRDGSNLRARHGLAEVYRREGKSGRARKHLTRILEDNPRLAPMLLPLVRRTLNLDVSRDKDRYLKLLEKLAVDENAALWIGLEQAELLHIKGADDACKSALEELLERYPGAFEVHEAYLNFLVATHREPEALTHLQRLLDLAASRILRFRCSNCGYLDSRAFVDCPRCGTFGHSSYHLAQKEPQHVSQ